MVTSPSYICDSPFDNDYEFPCSMQLADDEFYYYDDHPDYLSKSSVASPAHWLESFPNHNGLDYTVPVEYCPQAPAHCLQAPAHYLQAPAHCEEPNQMESKRKKGSTATKPQKSTKPQNQTIDDFISQAIALGDFCKTGLACGSTLPIDSQIDKSIRGFYIVIDEYRFYEFVSSIKSDGHKIKQPSLLEKMDKSRRCNRVNPKLQSGIIPIKYLRIDRDTNTEFYHSISNLVASMKYSYGNGIRIYTHRDWNLLPTKYFVYEKH